MSDSHYSESELSRDVRPTWLKGIAFLVILGLATGGLVYGAFAMRSKEGPKVAVAAPEPLTVEVADIEVATTFELEEGYAGLATASRTSQLGFSSGGRIDAINVRVGDRVTAGATLAKLDIRALGAQLASANAVVEEARASHRLALDTVG
ncbi:MAG TPA: efflux RND transporter periplasmic adaptor subunit, partial [Hyphomonas sp.]|nr:efflux RND transporter periplasmic adaptor subunit [Hyphomonas sp.]